jgi:hypothetical protein
MALSWHGAKPSDSGSILLARIEGRQSSLILKGFTVPKRQP